MSISETNEQFLREWLADQPEIAEGEEMPPVVVPWRLSFTSVAPNPAAVRACCGEWILRRLGEMSCPSPLAEYICRESLQEVVETFQSEYDDDRGDETDGAAASLIDGMKWCQLALTTCTKLCHGAAKGNVVLPQFGHKVLWNVSWDAIRNRRRKMEDRHVIIPYMDVLSSNKIEPTSLFAVFDGHRGADAAEFASAHLPSILMENENFEDDLQKCMGETLQEVDRRFLQYAESKGIKAGCTALVVCVRHNKLYVAWLGDSQLAVSRSGKAEIATAPHTASSKEEQDRVYQLGGICTEVSGSWRVSGQLAVSRAIGDSDLKKYLTSECDSLCLDITDDFDFIILGCDGLWDGVKDDTAMEAMRAEVEKHRDTDSQKLSAGTARAIVELARAASDDNITAVLVDLKNVCLATPAT